MKSIGGYFELELNQGKALHNDLVAVNSCRNALVYIVKAKGIRVIYLPYFNCKVVFETLSKFCPETEIHYYHIDSFFRPRIDTVDINQWIYYINYYGLQEGVIQELPYHRIIIDNAQAFYSPPAKNINTIYSARKFFGVSDGGYLSTSSILDQTLQHDTSWENSQYLLKRIDCGASAAYEDFRFASGRLAGRPLMKMSLLTQAIMSGIDYDLVKRKRKRNFKILHSFFSRINKLSAAINISVELDSFVPLCYPLMIASSKDVRKHFIENNIYIPTYWPELKDSMELNNDELDFVNHIICIPIDQRYEDSHMKTIISTYERYYC